MKPLPSVLSCLFVLLTVTAALPIAAAEPKPGERVLVDFKDQQAFRLTGNRAQAVVNTLNGHAGLEVVTEVEADFPNVRIDPTTGPWDLTGFDAVTAEVFNPEDGPLRVLLGVNNPGADGTKHCSVAALSLGAHERGALTVTLGQWHGEPRPLDPANVTSLEVLLDRPGRSHRFIVNSLKAVRHERFDLQEAGKDPFFQSLRPALGRGVNLGNALDAPREGEWGVTLEESYFQAIADAGFDSIRLPVRWSAHAAEAPPYTIDPKFFERVDWAIEQAVTRGLKVALDVHHYQEMDSHPDEHRERFVGLWKQIAERYRDRPPELMFELLNEPHDKLTATKWNAILIEALAVVRETNPTRTVVVGPVAWNGIGELKSLELPESDRNLLVTVHYYAPFNFTHQGAEWLEASQRSPVGTKWTGTDAERAAIARDFDAAALWGLKHRRPIFLGEFGAYGKADLESRARWTKCVAEEAAERRMSTAYWEFCSGFGAYDPVKRTWIEPLRAALLPEK